MSRWLTYLCFVIISLSSTLVHGSTAAAQSSTSDLTPIANAVPLEAFRALPGLAAAGSAAVVQETPPMAAPKEFTDMMLGWQVQPLSGATVRLEVRVSKDGAAWTTWAVVTPDTEIPDQQQRWSDIFYVARARYYQVRMTRQPNAAGVLPAVSDVKVHTLYVEDVPLKEAPRALPMADSGTVASSGMGLAAVARPTYVSRIGWGSPDGEGAPSAPPRYRKATHIVIHHTAESNTLGSYPNWASRVRAIWTYHAKTQGWGDIGYNWLIDPNGVIYAGRAGYLHTDLDPAGFHDAANHGSVGISIMGTYSTVAPSAAAQNSLVQLIAWKAAQRGIDPLGKGAYYGCQNSRYCAPYVAGGILPFITTHRNVMPGQTACPGDAFYNLVPQLRQRVADRIKAGGGTVIAPPTVPAYPIVSIGQSGPNVTTLQYLLRQRGYNLQGTGTFGPLTEASVKAFQSTVSMQPNGVVGPVTWSKLVVQLDTGAQGDAVKALQTQLNKHGYRLVVDGSFGPGTRSAVISFKQKVGLTSSFLVGPQTWQWLIGK